MDNLLLSGDSTNRPSPAGEILHLVEDVFEDDEIKGWEAVQHSLQSGIKYAFDPTVKGEFSTMFIEEAKQQIQGYLSKLAH